MNFTTEIGAEVYVRNNKGRRAVIADEGVVDRVAVVGAAEVRIAVVDLGVADPERHKLHQLVERLDVDRRGVDQQVAVLDPGLVVVTGRQVGRRRDADALAICAFRLVQSRSTASCAAGSAEGRVTWTRSE